MKCPFCNNQETKVTNSREIEEQTRRRRECLACNKRFTTYEKVENLNLVVVKKDGTKEPFEKEKIKKGIERASEKRPVTEDQICDLIEKIELKLKTSPSTEISSQEIGKLVMQELKKIDKVTYIRFASVYKEFEDVDEFYCELKKL